MERSQREYDRLALQGEILKPTMDVWEDRNSYFSFKERFAADSRKIDEDCETLTISERLIGIFEEVS